MRSSAAFGALMAVQAALARPSSAAAIWECPSSIDNVGQKNVSAALTEWLATTGRPGDVFRLRRNPGYAPGAYWIPQGIRIDKPMTLDLRGCWLYTGRTLGDTDPHLAWSRVLLPPLWPDEQPPDLWPLHRWCVDVSSPQVVITSSLINARIQGAARRAKLRSGLIDLPSGCHYDPAFEGQHCIRLGGSTPCEDTTVDLTNIALEFPHGDGILLGDKSRGIRILGRNLGPAVVGGEPATRDPDYLGAIGGLGADLDPDGYWHPQTPVYPGIHHTARQGIACGHSATDVLIDGVSVWRTGRTTFDLEPAGDGHVVDGVTIRNTEAGIHHLGWLAASANSCNNVTVESNVSYEALQVITEPSDPTNPQRHRGWTLTGNRGGLRTRSGAAMQVDRIDTLEISANLQRIGPDADGVDPGSSTRVSVDPVEAEQFPVSDLSVR